MAQSNRDDSPDDYDTLPTDRDGTPDYAAALDEMGISAGDVYRIHGHCYRFVRLKYPYEPYADILPLSTTNERTEARVDNLWTDYQHGTLAVGTADITFTPHDDA